jgi:hypothetical protein
LTVPNETRLVFSGKGARPVSTLFPFKDGFKPIFHKPPPQSFYPTPMHPYTAGYYIIGIVFSEQ